MDTKKAIESFIRSRQAKGLSGETIRWYCGILGKFCQRHPELPATPDPLYDFLASITAGDERRHGYYRALRALYNFLEKNNFPNPMRLVEPPRHTKKLPKPLWPEELSRLFNLQLKPIVRMAATFLADSGARLGELFNLTINDLVETQWGYVAYISGKTGRRLVPISYETYHNLMITLPIKITKHRLGRKIALAFKEAGLEGGAHRLRHTFATYWEGDETVLQRILGHAHLSTTLIYRGLRLGKMVEQHNKYSPLKTLLPSQKSML